MNDSKARTKCGFEVAPFRCGMAEGHLPAASHGNWMTADQWSDYETTGRWIPPAQPEPSAEQRTSGETPDGWV